MINERVDISDSTLSGDLPACGHVYVRESQGKTYGNIFFLDALGSGAKN